MRPTRYFEDYALGDVFVTDSATITEGQILQFARAFDTQTFHTNLEESGGGPFGGLIGSGLQTLNFSMALFFKLQLVQPVARGGAGMDRLRWTKPLRPGDTIHVECEVIEITPPGRNPTRGAVRMRHDTYNQDGQVIMTMECIHLIATRQPEAAQ